MRALGLALVPEDRKTQGLVPGMSALDNLCLASLSRTARRGVLTRAASAPRGGARRARARTSSSRTGARPSPSSAGGNQQKVVLGKWLMRAPRVLLCDEPTRGVDVRAKGQVFEALRAMGRRGIASIVVSSELEEVLELGDRILVLRRGTLVGSYRPRELTLDRLVALCMEGGDARTAAS